MALKKFKQKIPKWLFITIICCASVLILTAGFFGFLLVDTHINHDNILANVSVAGVDVGGMSKTEAIKAVREATKDTYSKRDLIIKIGEETHTISASLAGADLDVEAAVDAAYNYGRSGFLFRRFREQSNAEAGPVTIDITGYLNLNTEAIDSEIEKLVGKYNCGVTQTVYRFEGSMPEGTDLSEGDRVLVLQVGEPGYVLKSDRLRQQIMDSYNQNTYRLTADCQITKPAALDLDTLFQDNCIAPTNATMNSVTYRITDEINGYGFVKSNVQNALWNADPGQELSFPFQEIEPEVTRATIEAELFTDLLSEYTAEYSSSYNRDINLVLSCQAVNGTILLPGETFDYNSTLGERTPEAGYRLGNTYAGMETIQTYGGGICQTSSTLYYCAMMADLEIVTRTNHGFISDYVPFGMDATVSWGGPEFRFKNNTNYPIKIEAYSSNGDVTVKLWGKDDKDYYVKMEYEVLGVYGWKTVTKEFSSDNAKGYKNGQVLTSPYTGYKIQTYRCKYSKTDDQLISKEPEALSVYSTRNKVVVKIVENQPDTDTAEPTTPSTDSTAPTPSA